MLCAVSMFGGTLGVELALVRVSLVHVPIIKWV
jgi:hypothetical protein